MDNTNRRKMEDVKLDSSRARKITYGEPVYIKQVDNDIDEDTDTDTIKEDFFLEKEKEMEDKVDKYLNYRYTKKTLSSTPHLKSKKVALSKQMFIIFLFVLFIGGLYYSSIIFEKAEVTLVAKEQLVNLNSKQFTASKEMGAPLGFEIMIMSGEETKSMVLSKTENASIKSIGEVTLYNENSKNAQNLLIGTFLSDDSGKTYRLDKAVTIPGYKTDKDNKIIPGSVSVGITAFLPGDSYNGSPTDFSIVGFKGTSKYTKIYAQAKTPLTGGRSGLVYVLSEAEKKEITSMADSLIQVNLLKKLNAEVPDGYIYYPGAISYSYNLGENNFFENPKADVHIAYNLSVVILKKEELTKAIIKNTIPKISKEELNKITISDLSNLSFEFSNNDQSINKEMQSVLFKLTGDVNLNWNPNPDEMRTKLVGIPKDSILPIFNEEETIKQADLKMFPPWQKNLPIDPSRIKITVE